ncbi:uncharacterized protein LOC114517815 [Dendronephthya gigantea]|uniref:uncharacterized protein LOC114517815 n=1 Tax=Dendronephthya gigantea TaxID=151771 RepID=UPI00106C3A36|nr:uncharacterized protein LOC114517815 [Dendronephthya gigantea]
MKYFAIFVVFGLFALSQALPVEESKEKRLFFNKETLYEIVGYAKGACEKIKKDTTSTPNPLIARACACLSFTTGIVSLFDDESGVEEKRFFISFKDLIAKVQNMIDKVCNETSSRLLANLVLSEKVKYDDLCKCISF